jgi:hypothetical protein
MSSFAPLQALLERYYGLEFHRNPQLAARLLAVQNWQKKRMEHTHVELFAVPAHRLMTEYFLTRLYGGPDFAILAQQFERIIAKAKKFEKFVPNSTIQTGCEGIELAVLAIELDQELAQYLLEHPEHDTSAEFDPNGDFSDLLVIDLYQKANQNEARHHQLNLLDKLGIGLDKYVRSFMTQQAFKMAKSAALRHNFEPVYTFLDEGFAAMKPLKSAEVFIGVFTRDERALIERVHAGVSNPFNRA